MSEFKVQNSQEPRKFQLCLKIQGNTIKKSV